MTELPFNQTHRRCPDCPSYSQLPGSWWARARKRKVAGIPWAATQHESQSLALLHRGSTISFSNWKSEGKMQSDLLKFSAAGGQARLGLGPAPHHLPHSPPKATHHQHISKPKYQSRIKARRLALLQLLSQRGSGTPRERPHTEPLRPPLSLQSSAFLPLLSAKLGSVLRIFFEVLGGWHIHYHLHSRILRTCPAPCRCPALSEKRPPLHPTNKERQKEQEKYTMV